MYVALLVIPVPADNYEAYLKWAENSARIFRRYGCLEIIDGWEDLVPVGKNTDFRRAVNAQGHEKIVVSLQVWPDKDQFFAAETKMHEENALEIEGAVPFDASRLIYGCFASLPNAAAVASES